MYKPIIFVLTFLCFISCKQEKQQEETDKNAPITMNGEAYGSTYHIVYYSHGVVLNDEIQKVLEEFDRSVNTYKPTSVLSKFNEDEIGARADDMLLEMVRLSRNFNTTSNGYFDPSVAPLSDIWGFSGNGVQHIPSQEQIDSVKSFIGLDKIQIHRDSISKLDRRVRLSFNAMTGYVNDKVAAVLDENKVESYLIEIGGEVYAKGKKPNGETWKVGIDSPIEDLSKREIYASVSLENQALATSGNYRKFYQDPETGRKVAHTINPITGQSEISNLLSVTVIANSCSVADAMATATMAMGLAEAKKFIQQRSDLQFFLIWSEAEGVLKSEAYNGFITL